MSNGASGGSTTGSGAPADAGNNRVAEQYVADQLGHARSSLRRTQILCVLVLCLVLGYVTFIVGTVSRYLQPKTAAEVATSLLTEQAEARTQEVAANLKREIPAFIARLPDLALEQLPDLRGTVETRIEAELAAYCQSTSSQLAKHLDSFLDEHKDKLKPLLAASRDSTAWDQLGEDLEKELVEYLQTKAGDGESLKEQFDKSLEALTTINERLHRLATEQNLSIDERKQRRAIAILVHAAKKQL
jgi:hypothetical protein